MSQMRAMRFELRAMVAVIAVCALVFSLLIAGAAHRMHDGSSGKIALQGKTHAVMCHDRVSAFDPSTPSKNGPVDHKTCPDCCLAALVVSAVLPDRVATLARVIRAAAPISYVAFATRELEAPSSGAVNGARAPPSQHPIS